MKIERGEDPGPFRKAAQYKPHLRPLFRCRCAYCLMPDDRLGGEEGMTVDHFRPESRYPDLRLAWANLYYACSVCNSQYKRDYPTLEEERAGKRFVDPCANDYDDHFRLAPDPATGALCRVRPLSEAAEYSVLRLKLNYRKPLHDYWRGLNQEETLLLEREIEIRERLEDCKRLTEQGGPNDELRHLRRDYELQLRKTHAELADVRQLRPFPVEQRPTAG